MIRVGGATEIEVKERKDRVDDAMHATRAAVEEGILPGGGVALLRAGQGAQACADAQRRPEDGVEIVRKAIQARHARSPSMPARTARSSSARSWRRDQYAFGFDAQTGEYVNMVSKGIIDPTKVVRQALQDAASVAGLLITTEAMVAELPKKQRPPRRCRAAAAWAAWTSDR